MNYEKKTMSYEIRNEPKTNPIYPVVASGEAGTNPISKQPPGPICLFRLLINGICCIYGLSIIIRFCQNGTIYEQL